MGSRFIPLVHSTLADAVEGIHAVACTTNIVRILTILVFLTGEVLENVVGLACHTLRNLPSEALRTGRVALPRKSSLNMEDESEHSSQISHSPTTLPPKSLGLPVWGFHFDIFLINLN